MALPPKGDPRRPLHLAARSTRVLGIIFLLIGCMAAGTAGGRIKYLPMMILLLVFLGPGSGYLIVSIFLKRRAFWAVMTGLVIASLHALMAISALALLAFLLATVGSTKPMSAIFVILGLLIWLAAIAQLIYHLSKSFAALRLAEESFRGFEPLPPHPSGPAAPLPPTPPPPAGALPRERHV